LEKLKRISDREEAIEFGSTRGAGAKLGRDPERMRSSKLVMVRKESLVIDREK
jgi:hypothetical protein